jgi:hypothetical protein
MTASGSALHATRAVVRQVAPNLDCMSGIGVLREGPLHAAIKAILAAPGDRLEVPVGRFVIDLVRADGELVEVQTGGFGPLGAKLDVLLDEHRIRIVHPIAATRRIVRVDRQGQVVSMRRSTKHGSVVEVFDKLVAFPSLLTHPTLTIEVMLLDEDHVRGVGPVTARRRTRDPGERRLRDVLSRVELNGVDDIVCALPPLPREPFTTRELASALGCSMLLAQRTAYCLRAVDIIEAVGKRGHAPLYRPSSVGDRCQTRFTVCGQQSESSLGSARTRLDAASDSV